MMSQMEHYQKNRAYQKRVEDIEYCRTIRQFLESFKTNKCLLEDQHLHEICYNYHDEKDKRRNPYMTHTFLYYPKKKCTCENTKCPHFHNNFEYNYHPLQYRTQRCIKKECLQYFSYCFYLHKNDQIHFEQGQFFRFDITTFKTKKCQRQDKHERKVCLGFHNEKDRRRPNFNDYNHMLCNKNNCNDQCPRSQNKIQQLYHPSRYKTKFCQTYSKDTYLCDYRDFCSFAHTKEEITIELIDPDNKDPNYIVNTIKTIWCPQTLDHDRSECPYAHNIQDFRRKPSEFNYRPDKCPHWDFQSKIQCIEMAKCIDGMKCTMCHGWMEQRYHPLVYLSGSKKGTTKSYVKRQEKNDKKQLKKSKESDKQKQKEQSHQQVVPKASFYAKGAPFFKNESDKTKHPGSEKSYNNSEANNLNILNKQFMKKMAVNGSVPQKIAPVYFQHEQHEIWNFQQEQLNRQRKSDTRSKSQGTSSEYAPSYSRSIVETLNDSGILKKLYHQNVNQVSLINSNDKKVNNMPFLDHLEKQKLIRKLKQYSLRKFKKGIQYTKNLTNFFMKNQAQGLLSKFLVRKIGQQKILKLQSRQSTKDFSFLNEEEKQLLPKLLKKFSQQIQFNCMMQDVKKYVKEQ